MRHVRPMWAALSYPMAGVSAVTSMSEFFTLDSIAGEVSVMPFTKYSAKPSGISSQESVRGCKKLWMMTGFKDVQLEITLGPGKRNRRVVSRESALRSWSLPHIGWD